MKAILLTLALLVVLLSSQQASAQHYRLGRYFPLRSGELGSMDRSADIPVVVGTHAQTPETILPVLAIHDLAGSVHALQGDERLVGIATPDASLAAELFPGRKIIEVQLDPGNPLPGPALAWGVLDAILLDPAAASRVSAKQLETLRAFGTAVAIRTEARPAGDWPWQRRGGWWVLPPDSSASVELVQPDQYAPAGDLVGAPTPRFRQVLIAALACFVLAVIAMSLWRRRRAWITVVALSILASGGIALWNSNQPKSAWMVREENRGVWLDRYEQHVARADAEIRHAVPAGAAATWPVLFSPTHARDVGLALECRVDGTPDAFVAHLKRGQSIVFLDRSRAAAPIRDPQSLTPAPSPAGLSNSALRPH